MGELAGCDWGCRVSAALPPSLPLSSLSLTLPPFPLSSPALSLQPSCPESSTSSILLLKHRLSVKVSVCLPLAPPSPCGVSFDVPFSSYLLQELGVALTSKPMRSVRQRVKNVGDLASVLPVDLPEQLAAAVRASAC